MTNLPPLTSKINKGAEGGHEFERLMNQLLLCYADRHGFEYEPAGSAGGDHGIDGLARRGGVPGFEGPVAFQFKWLWDSIHKESNAKQITDWLKRAAQRREIQHWILVTPHELTPAEKDWLLAAVPVWPRKLTPAEKDEYRALCVKLHALTRDEEERLKALSPRKDLTVHHWGQARIEGLLRDYCPALLARYYPHEAKPLLSGYDGHDFQEFAAEYRRKVAIAHRRLRTIGLPPETLRERNAGAEIPLRQVFVPQNILPEGDRQQILPLVELLRAGRSCVLLGDPGTGKTTILSFVALLFCGEAEIEDFSAPVAVVPLLIPLRDLLKLRQEKTDLEFLEYLASRARSDLNLPHAHRAFFEAKLRMGEAVVLVDGLDEAGGDVSRQRLSTAIQTFQAEFPDCPCWVTSRVYGYTRDVRLPNKTFAHYSVARLDAAQVDDFIARWYALQYSDNPREQDERVRSLQHAVRRTPSVQRLAGNPLLLTLMAFIHHGQRSLPQDRGELYEQCVQMLLKTWQEAKRGGLAAGHAAEPHPFEKLALHVATQKDYLAHLAMRAQELNQAAAEDEGRGLIRRADALDCFARRHLDRSLRTRPDAELAEAREDMEHFLDYVSDRTGLLIDKGGGQLSFIHLSFQEYLAAWVFTCGGVNVSEQRAFFESHLGQAGWEEVLLLRLYIILRLPGGGGETVFDAVIRSLLERLEQQPSAAGWLTLVHAVRDNLEFSARDRKTILQQAVASWLEPPPQFEGDWFRALEEVCLFSPDGKRELSRILEAGCQHGERLVLQAIEQRIPIKDRHKLAVELGQLGDPRITVDLRVGTTPGGHRGYVMIPAGSYRVGDEKRAFAIREPFWLGRYPVTNSQYALFINDGGYSRQEFWSDEGCRWVQENGITTPESWRDPKFNAPNQPVVGVSWWEAEAFCRWAGGRLPTVDESEAASRGPRGLEYPWGDKWEDRICNSREASLHSTSAVGIFPRSRSVPFELEDAAGNVWEWCADGDATYRVHRGGSWAYFASFCRSAARVAWSEPAYRYQYVGFRVAAVPPGGQSSASRTAEPGA